MASPHQVHFCDHLQKFFETEFWFYEHIDSTRPEWWKIDLPPSCKVIGHLWYKRNGRYVTFEVIKMLRRYNPDVIMLGGFVIPSNYLAYLWARKHGKKVIVYTETSRKKGKLCEKSIILKLFDFLYRHIDALFVVHDTAAEQMRRLLPHMGKLTHVAHYSTDIDRYFEHPIRRKKAGYIYIFPNKLIDIYNPLLAIEIFAEIHAMYPQSILRINSQGQLLNDCHTLIRSLGIADSVQFLSEIKHWDDLSDIYRQCDILLFPAKFSNGNFTIFECMASGMGIIISNKILLQASIIKDGENGFVREPDKVQFLDAVQQYIDNPELFRKHAAINREITRAYTGAETAKLYAKLINEKVLHNS
jgi:glycosyltransferase involved in cell wall biosynthesis